MEYGDEMEIVIVLNGTEIDPIVSDEMEISGQ